MLCQNHTSHKATQSAHISGRCRHTFPNKVITGKSLSIMYNIMSPCNNKEHCTGQNMFLNPFAQLALEVQVDVRLCVIV